MNSDSKLNRSVQMIHIVKEIDQERPDLIIYDFMAVYFKWAMKYYSKCFRRELKTFDVLYPLPPVVFELFWHIHNGQSHISESL